MKLLQEELFYKTFSNIDCINALGYKFNGYLRKKEKYKPYSISNKISYVNKNREIEIIYCDNSNHIQFWINNLDKRGSISIELWLKDNNYIQKNIFSFNDNETNLKKNFIFIRDKFEEVCEIDRLKDILQGKKWENQISLFERYK